MPTKKRPVPIKKMKAEDVTPEQATANKFEKLMERYAEADRARAEAALEADAAKKEMEEMLRVLPEGETTIKGKAGQATLVQGSSIKLDDALIQLRVTHDQWEKITTRVFDQKLFEKAVTEGEVDSKIAQDATTVVAKKPYVKVTVR